MGETTKRARRSTVLLALFALLISASLVGGGVSLFQRLNPQAALNKRFAESDARQIQTWHIVLCLAEGETLADKTLTTDQKVRAVKFYDKALDRIHAEPCSIPRSPK